MRWRTSRSHGSVRLDTIAPMARGLQLNFHAHTAHSATPQGCKVSDNVPLALAGGTAAALD